MSELEWWETAVIYQIYPRSFQDSNGDGIGDLPGITRRLDYIAGLGVDVVWISPFFASPQKDFGYDVSDYCAINPEYGTLDDFDHLIERVHERGLRLMIDIVPAHCSDQHDWFKASRQSRDNDKADWFHWVDPLPDGSAPTNWLSFFGGRAWSWEPQRQQYYLHNFLPSQPNLNHANPAVREALMQVARFWFDRGVDGFRLDAVHTINADTSPYRNNPPNPDFTLGPLPQDQQPFFRQLHDAAQLNQPSIQQFSEAIRAVADEYEGRFLMGEVDGDNDDAVKVSATFTTPGRLHATYNFDLLEWAGLTVDEMKQAISCAIQEFNDSARLCFAFSNHDVPRAATRQLLVCTCHTYNFLRNDTSTVVKSLLRCLDFPAPGLLNFLNLTLVLIPPSLSKGYRSCRIFSISLSFAWLVAKRIIGITIFPFAFCSSSSS